MKIIKGEDFITISKLNLLIMNNSNIKNRHWRQGYTLYTSTTKRWLPRQIEENNEVEGRIIFENFNEEDFGASRKRICICDDTKDAELICKAVNEYDKLKAINDTLLDALKDTQKTFDNLILATPTGETRNILTYANIKAMEAILKSTNTVNL